MSQRHQNQNNGNNIYRRVFGTAELRAAILQHVRSSADAARVECLNSEFSATLSRVYWPKIQSFSIISQPRCMNADSQVAFYDTFQVNDLPNLNLELTLAVISWFFGRLQNLRHLKLAYNYDPQPEDVVLLAKPQETICKLLLSTCWKAKPNLDSLTILNEFIEITEAIELIHLLGNSVKMAHFGGPIMEVRNKADDFASYHHEVFPVGCSFESTKALLESLSDCPNLVELRITSPTFLMGVDFDNHLSLLNQGPFRQLALLKRLYMESINDQMSEFPEGLAAFRAAVNLLPLDTLHYTSKYCISPLVLTTQHAGNNFPTVSLPELLNYENIDQSEMESQDDRERIGHHLGTHHLEELLATAPCLQRIAFNAGPTVDELVEFMAAWLTGIFGTQSNNLTLQTKPDLFQDADLATIRQLMESALGVQRRTLICTKTATEVSCQLGQRRFNVVCKPGLSVD